MEKKNDDFLKLISKTKDSMNKIQIATKDKEKIENSIKNIRNEVTKINDFLRKFDETIKEETRKLNEYQSEINSIQFQLLKNDTDKIKSIIQANLPNTIISKEYENKIVLYRVTSIDKKKDKIINKEECIGSIEIAELEENKNEVVVNIKDESMKIDSKENFEVVDPLRIYNIIVNLNMKLNYETT